MATTLGRSSGSQAMTFFKPMIRKAYHRKSSPPDSFRETMKMEADKVKIRSHGESGFSTGSGTSTSTSISWVPHEKTGLYYPKGQEKVIEDVPAAASGAAEDIGVVNWFYHNE